MRFTIVLLGLWFAAGAAWGLLINGGFEQPLDSGWTDTVVGTTGLANIERSDTLGQPVPGFAARVYKTLAEYASLSQTVDVPNAYLCLNFDARFRIGGGSSTCWPVCAFVVRYRDAAGTSLGNTKFYLHDQYCTWASSDTQSLVDITSPEVWGSYVLYVSQELADHLPGINPDQVRKLTIELFAYDNGT